jgi:hypothetical protein
MERVKQAALQTTGHQALTVRDNNVTYRSRSLDEIAPSTRAGELIKFTKDGTFATVEDGVALSHLDGRTCSTTDLSGTNTRPG